MSGGRGIDDGFIGMFKSNFIEDCFKDFLYTIQWSYRPVREYEGGGRTMFCVSLKSDRPED